MAHTDATPATRTADDFARELDTFSGSLTQYRHPLSGITYTEGVHHLAAESTGVIGTNGRRCDGAFWLLDAIASHQPKARSVCDGFQLWTLVRNGEGATLRCRPDSDQEPVVTQEIAYTDFPLPEVKLYVIDGVMLLPDEY